MTGETNSGFSFFDYLVSPTLTKVGVAYWTSLVGDPSSIFKSVNYDTSAMTDVTIDNETQFTTTIRDTGFNLDDYAFGDYYFVLRVTPSGGGNPAEVSYQFMGGKLYYLREQENTDGYSVSKLIID